VKLCSTVNVCACADGIRTAVRARTIANLSAAVVAPEIVGKIRL